MAKRYYWLKLKEDFFDDDTMQWIEEQPNGDKYELFYLKLCLKAIKSNGILIRNVGNTLIPYNAKKISELTRTDIDTVRVAMELFEKIGLVQILENGEIYISQLENMVGSESKWAKYKRNRKLTVEDLPPLINCKRLSCEQILLPDGQVKFVDEKRYGGNGGLAYDRANGQCETCGSTANLCLHHSNEFSNNLKDIKVLCRKCHSRLEKLQPSSKTVPIEKEIEKEKDIELDKERETKEKNLSLGTTEVLNFIEEKACVSLSSQFQSVSELVEKYEIQDIKEAISKSLSKGKKGVAILNYANGILKNWAVEGKEESHGGNTGSIKQDFTEGKYKGFKPKPPDVSGEIDETGLI